MISDINVFLFNFIGIDSIDSKTFSLNQGVNLNGIKLWLDVFGINSSDFNNDLKLRL